MFEWRASDDEAKLASITDKYFPKPVQYVEISIEYIQVSEQ